MSAFVGLPLPITLINNRSIVFKSSVWSFESFGPKYLGQDLDGRGAMAAALVSLCQAAWDRCVQNLYENCHRLLPHTRSKLNIETLPKKHQEKHILYNLYWVLLDLAAMCCNHVFQNGSSKAPKKYSGRSCIEYCEIWVQSCFRKRVFANTSKKSSMNLLMPIS